MRWHQHAGLKEALGFAQVALGHLRDTRRQVRTAGVFVPEQLFLLFGIAIPYSFLRQGHAPFKQALLEHFRVINVFKSSISF